ncbi:MAG: PepSY-like domain-containing protein [Chitinophagaceae bacterium]
MKKIFMATMLLFLLSIINHADAQIRKVPAEVTEAFKEKYPDTKNVEWKDKLSNFQVTYEKDGVKYESKFSSKGVWLQTEKDIAEETLPSTVKDGYSKSKFTDWEVKTATRVESKNNGIQYRLFVKKNDIEKKYLYFNEDGRLVKDVITI